MSKYFSNITYELIPGWGGWGGGRMGGWKKYRLVSANAKQLSIYA